MIAHGHLRLRTLCSPGKSLVLAYLCTIRMHDQAGRGLVRLRRTLFGQPSRCWSMCGEEVRDYFPFCAGKFVSLGHGRILCLESENSAENQASRGSGEVSKVFIQNLVVDNTLTVPRGLSSGHL